MARIRTIKPEFPQSESIGRLSRDARLLFIQLWTIADDHGRLRGSPRLLASLLYPYDTDAPKLMDGWLSELEAEGCVRRYMTDGDTFIDIPNWSKHQRIDNAGKSKIPEFRGEPPQENETVGDPPLDLGPRTIGIGPRKDIRAVAKATRPEVEKTFDEKFWPNYPKRLGANPKAPARKLFLALIKSGHDPEIILRGVDCYRADLRSRAQEGSQYVAQAVTWLRQARWGDYQTTGPPKDTEPAWMKPPPGAPTHEEILAQFNGQDHAQTVGTEVRSSPGMDKDRTG